MTLVLRKSFDRFSAGTVVTLVTQPGKTRDPLIVSARYTHVESHVDWSGKRHFNYEPRTVEFEVPVSYLTELRNRTDVVPTKNKAARRAEKRKAQTILAQLTDRQMAQ